MYLNIFLNVWGWERNKARRDKREETRKEAEEGWRAGGRGKARREGENKTEKTIFLEVKMIEAFWLSFQHQPYYFTLEVNKKIQ